MRRFVRILFFAVMLGAACLFMPLDNATAHQSNGLLIAPLREYVGSNAGKTTTRSITVANLTDKPLVVALSVEQFAVTDYTYDYRFRPAKEKWITLGQTEVHLAAGRSRQISYQIAVPVAAAPGGHYFTIVATTSLASGNIHSKVRAATVLYLTVNGKLTTTSAIRGHTAPRISWGSGITFSLSVRNTGNTHFFAYASGRLHGLGPTGQGTETTSLLLPDATRVISGTVPSPLLPGLYRLTYGYRGGGQTAERAQYILYIPPWSLVVCLGLYWAGTRYWKRRIKQRATRS